MKLKYELEKRDLFWIASTKENGTIRSFVYTSRTRAIGKFIRAAALLLIGKEKFRLILEVDNDNQRKEVK